MRAVTCSIIPLPWCCPWRCILTHAQRLVGRQIHWRHKHTHGYITRTGTYMYTLTRKRINTHHDFSDSPCNVVVTTCFSTEIPKFCFTFNRLPALHWRPSPSNGDRHCYICNLKQTIIFELTSDTTVIGVFAFWVDDHHLSCTYQGHTYSYINFNYTYIHMHVICTWRHCMNAQSSWKFKQGRDTYNTTHIHQHLNKTTNLTHQR